MTMKTLIPAQTAEATQRLSVGTGARVTVTCGKLAAAEVVTFQILEEDVVTPGDLYQDGSIKQLDATNNATVIVGPIDLQVKKSATAAATGVYMRG